MVHDLLGQAYEALRHNRRRTALTMLGMAWGIATVVLLLAYGAGFGRAINNIFSNFGVHVMAVEPGRTSLQAGGSKAGTQVRFTLEDIEHLRNLVPLIRHISPQSEIEAKVQHDNRSSLMNVGGFTSDVQYIRALKMEEGRFYNPQDELQKSRVAVIGSEARHKLFSGQFAIGDSIRLNGLSFQ